MSGQLAFVAFLLLQVAYQGVQGWSWYCQPDDIAGTWTFTRADATQDSFSNCYNYWPASKDIQHRIQLIQPNLAIDEYGNFGHWTSIYGVAVEVTIHGRKYYTFFEWKRIGCCWWTINCNKLESGSSRDVLTHNYACFNGAKSWRKENETKLMDEAMNHPRNLNHIMNQAHPRNMDEPTTTENPPTFVNDPTPTNVPTFERHHHHHDEEIDHEQLVKSINENQMWRAHVYDHFKDLSDDDRVMLAGGNMSLRAKPPTTAPRTKDQLQKTVEFPRAFDWRDVDGENYVSPVRDQGRCGSCYAFAALGMYESRYRIMTKNTIRPILSPQDVVDCSPYAYGCCGGWIFTEGKYAEEFGFIDEVCNTYNAQSSQCSRDSTCEKYYATEYTYVGGYFGASNDLEIMYSLYYDGPVVVGMAIYLDFFYYRSGVYYHAGPSRIYGYHAVTVVGWGADERSGTKYWIVKNSWGKNWGEDGYFRIARGINDCDIESYAFEAYPII